MSRLELSVATTDYDHFRDFRFGLVEAEGIKTHWMTLGHHEIFARYTFNREFDVSELSFAKFMAQITREKPDIVGLPVVCSRTFRFASFYVNKNSNIKSVEDLRGKRIGSPEWAHSAAVYMRGWMHNDCNVKIEDIHWYQAGTDAPGRIEKVELSLPPGVRLTRVSDKSLSDMLASGELDCCIIGRPPACFQQGHPDVVRLFPEYAAKEEDYYRRTKIWPIMHIMTMKRSIADNHPWVARNLYNAFLDSKRRSVERLVDMSVSRYPLPWGSAHARRVRDLLDGDPFPFGIDANRATLEQMLLYSFQQGIAHKHVTPEDIFPAGIMTQVVV